MLSTSTCYLNQFTTRSRKYSLGKMLRDLEFDFFLTQKGLFLEEDFLNQDVEMTPEKPSEESKRQKSRSSSKHAARGDKDVIQKQWDVNLRDKLNLSKFTKALCIGPGIGKLRDHKDTSYKRYQNEASGSKYGQRAYPGYELGQPQNYKISKPEEPEKIMKEINFDKNFEVDYVELLTKYEFPAVLRLQKKFMTWLCKYMHSKIQEKRLKLEEKKLYKEEQERRKRVKDEEKTLGKGKHSNFRPDQMLEKSNSDYAEIYDLDEIDPLEDNPTKILRCAFCLRNGKRSLSGRLIPFRANQFIHINCALWTHNVFDDKEGHILNFYFSYKNARLTKCTHCGDLGASVKCERPKCNNVYHFPCALKIDCYFTAYSIY